MDSILTSIKLLLGIAEEDTHFDAEVIMHINSALMDTSQLGVGPDNGFYITDKTQKWSEFIGVDQNLEAVKTYVYLKVRLIFDPPSSSSVIDAMERRCRESEWRINAQADKPIPEPIVI